MPELAEVAVYRSRWLPALRHTLTQIHLSTVAPLLPPTLSRSTLSRSLHGKKFLFLDYHGKKLLCGFSRCIRLPPPLARRRPLPQNRKTPHPPNPRRPHHLLLPHLAAMRHKG
jgi:hypothetical protein